MKKVFSKSLEVVLSIIVHLLHVLADEVAGDRLDEDIRQGAICTGTADVASPITSQIEYSTGAWVDVLCVKRLCVGAYSHVTIAKTILGM
jgi:hypothetical protein